MNIFSQMDRKKNCFDKKIMCFFQYIYVTKFFQYNSQLYPAQKSIFLIFSSNYSSLFLSLPGQHEAEAGAAGQGGGLIGHEGPGGGEGLGAGVISTQARAHTMTRDLSEASISTSYFQLIIF